jgi:TatD DNase family protein
MSLPYKGQVTGVFHCFSSHLEDAKRAVDLGFYIGIDGPITFKKAHDLVDIVKNIDLKHILVETDSPYLSPMPYRGKRNEPAYTKHVVKKIAELKKMTYREVSDQTTKMHTNYLI